jgi:outer membrane protein OmpA-like peptidoglycan-associated protein
MITCTKGVFCLMAFILLSNAVLAQSSFTPHKLSSNINSDWSEINPVLSPDGKTLYFVRVNHPENTYGEKDSEDIWFSTLQKDNTWSTAARLNSLNEGRYNAVLSVSGDGNTLLLTGIYNKRGTFWKKRGLSTSSKIGGGWSTPAKLKVKALSRINRGRQSDASMSADGNFLVFSFSKRSNGKRSNRANLFMSEKKSNGKWSKPKKIKPLNSRFSEEAPFISAEGKTLYFSSDQKQKGQFDIYQSKRNDASEHDWSQPVALSDTINTASTWESYFKTNVKGSYAYFSSTKDTKGDADIFEVKVFEENPFVIASGDVRNSVSSRLLKGKTFTILVNGKPAENVRVSSDSATYTLKLPLRKSYSIAVATPNYSGVPETLDVSTVREFTQMKKNLKATPLPYVLVKGNLFTSDSSSRIPASAKPYITVDGKPADSVLLNANEGTYSLKLKFGTTYSLQVNADLFQSLPETLDLTAADEYQEIDKSLYAEEGKTATLTGTIIDKKTNQAIAKADEVSIKVEGLDTVRAVINASGVYVLRLPLGSAYTISASAPNYYPVYETVDISQEKGNIKIFKDLIIVPIEVGQSIRINNIFFESGKSVLKKESFPELDRVAEFLATSADIKIEIAGHTDNVGKPATNQKLSLARAKAVTNYLIKAGIAKERIIAKGYGISKPVADNKTKEGKAKNRRVEFTILDK